MQKIILVCGVSGAGKSWACRQVAEKFHYIPHDRCWTYPNKTAWDPSALWAADLGDDSRYLPGAKSNHVEVLIEAAKIAKKPILTECPFSERTIREQLETAGLEVFPVFVIEPPDVVQARYEKREAKTIPKNVYTRASSIQSRADEWGSFWGSSDAVLKYLKNLS